MDNNTSNENEKLVSEEAGMENSEDQKARSMPLQKHTIKKIGDGEEKRAVAVSEEDKKFISDTMAQNQPKKKKVKGAKKDIGLKIAISIITFIVILLLTVVVLCNVLLNGPSKTLRDQLVLSAKQASATKWMPALFMDDDEVLEIEKNSKTVYYDSVPLDPKDDPQIEDEWANAKDGMIFKTLSLPTCKAYMLIIKDPSRVFVGVSSDDFKSAKIGKGIFEIADKYGAVAAINGGEFPDTGGMGTGANPIGLTYSQGKTVWNDGHTKRTFIGFDKDNILHVEESMTKDQADKLGIRDAVCFQTGNTLVTNDGENIVRHYANGDKGTSQRTAIGQRKDGAVIFLVTDGRTASSVGATHNDVVDTMVEYGAVVAAKLDGGSSALMYYRDYFTKYGYDLSLLDQYQKQGLVNKYKAFTYPRKIPTYFVVAGEN